MANVSIPNLQFFARQYKSRIIFFGLFEFIEGAIWPIYIQGHKMDLEEFEQAQENFCIMYMQKFNQKSLVTSNKKSFLSFLICLFFQSQKFTHISLKLACHNII